MKVYIEGNIGSGKSTFVDKLSKYINDKKLNAKVLKEPVECWQNTKDKEGKNILEYYYEDQQKYAFSFQMNAFISRCKEIKELLEQNYQYNFIERSVYTDRNVFMKFNYELDNINEIEHTIYEQWFDFHCNHFDLEPSLFIYLKVDYNICDQRIKKRNRLGESNIPLEYLKNIEDYHNKWLSEEKTKGIEVLEIDASINYLENEKELERVFESIINYVQK